MKIATTWLAGFSLMMSSWGAQAALIAVHHGQIVDDTANDTLWVADGNLFHTLANAEGDPSGFVQKVIDASGGVIDDTPNENDTPPGSGRYALKTTDFDPASGNVNWYGAQAFVHYLDTIRYLGYSDWRQPITTARLQLPIEVGTAPGELDPASGELSELFYTELAARNVNNEYPDAMNANAALFRNLQSVYYFGTETTIVTDGAGLFLYGYVAARPKDGNKGYAAVFPVRTGQASLQELLGAIASADGNANGDDRKRVIKAAESLHRTCRELGESLDADDSAGQSTSPALLDADVAAIRAVIGCR